MRLLLLLVLLYTSLWSSRLEEKIRLNIGSESQTIKSLYAMNGNRPLWVGHAKNFNQFIELLQNPFYNYKNKLFKQDIIDQYSYLLHNNMNPNENIQELYDLEIALTDSYINLANFIVKSDINWDKVSSNLSELKESKDIKASWEMVKKRVPSVKKLFTAISNQEIESFYKSLTPLKKRHQALINALQKYQNMYEIKKVKYGKDLKQGESHPRIPAIKKRLAISGDFPEKEFYNDMFDEPLKSAIVQYKKRFNLEQNDVIDKVTIYYLNKPVNLLITDIITNLDKLKVFPDKFPSEVVIVNIPEFRMNYYKNSYPVLSMNAVVGRDVRPTPIFASKMTYLVLNPTWNIPTNLVRRDLIPALEENPNYMKEHHINAYKGWAKNSKKIKDFSVSKLLPYKDGGNIPYRFVQSPGDDNALGRVKFMFPNKYSVYLHDTDNKDLLTRRYRVYSSGCMRLHHPFQLLELLKPRLNASSSRVDKYLASKKTKHLRFKKKLAVQTVYFTVFDRDGKTYFRKDIYGYDKFIQDAATEEQRQQSYIPMVQETESYDSTLF
ncbi:MAG: L,D-transpeptidase family protein [Sulfurovaceae bacterium]|nr:L,D-transpeptidase family protein [Sulfurovaceae bacterium]